MAPMTTLVLLGDSHLALMGEADVRRLAAACGADDVARAAVSGSTSADVAAQLAETVVPAYAVISVGSNDVATGDTHVPLSAYRTHLGETLQRLSPAYVVVLGPPPVLEARVDGDRTNAGLAAYAAAASDAATEHLATYVRTDVVLGGEGTALEQLLEDDGLHLSAQGYARVVAALADALGG